MTNNHYAQFYAAKLQEARERMQKASENADFAAWKIAELDVQNYENALKRVQQNE